MTNGRVQYIIVEEYFFHIHIRKRNIKLYRVYSVIRRKMPLLNHPSYLRERFLLTVICYQIFHWLETSREVDISRARSASDLFADD